MSSNNLALWNAVQTTDPAHTKSYSGPGGFKGTATNATFLAKRATEQFGPCGIGWGVTVLDERVLDGAPLMDGAIAKVHRVHIRLWYKLGDERGEIEHFGQTTLVGKNKYGLYTDEDAPKKSLTDAMTKALSLLGFAADIHLGLYDDNRYVSELRKTAATDAEAQPATRPAAAPRAIPAEVARSHEAPPGMEQKMADGLIAAGRTAQSEEELDAWKSEPNVKSTFRDLPEDLQVRVTNALAQHRQSLKARAA